MQTDAYGRTLNFFAKPKTKSSRSLDSSLWLYVSYDFLLIFTGCGGWEKNQFLNSARLGWSLSHDAYSQSDCHIRRWTHQLLHRFTSPSSCYTGRWTHQLAHRFTSPSSCHTRHSQQQRWQTQLSHRVSSGSDCHTRGELEQAFDITIRS